MKSPNLRLPRHFSILFFIAWRNIWRNPVRSLLTISALAGGLVVVILYAVLLEGMSRQMVHYATGLSTGQAQLHRQAFIDDQDLYATVPWHYLTQLEQTFPSLNFAPRLYAAGLASSEKSSTGVMIRAVDPVREKRVTSMLSHMRSGHSGLSEPFNVLVGAQLAKNLQLQLDSELILVTQAADGSIGNGLYRVVGILKPLEPSFDRLGIVVSIETFQELMVLESGFHEVAISSPDSTHLSQIQAELKQALDHLVDQEGLDVLGGEAVIRTWLELNPSAASMLEMSQSMLLIIGLVVVGLASMGMLNTMLMAVHERQHEFAILLAIGMQARVLLLIVLLESLFLALLSAIIGSSVGSALGYYLQETGIDFSQSMPDGYDWGGMVFEPIMTGYLELYQVGYACVLMILVALVTALFPCWRAIRIKPAQVL